MARRTTGPSPETRQLVMERDGYACVKCGAPVSGEPGRDYWHVRQARRRGSS